jgi:hypothetical protein
MTAAKMMALWRVVLSWHVLGDAMDSLHDNLDPKSVSVHVVQSSMACNQF